MSSDLVIQDKALPTHISAADFEHSMTEATAKAKVLTKVIAAQADKYVVRAQGQEFLRYEAWATLAQGYGMTAGIDTIENVLDTDGHTVLGVKATAVLRDSLGTQIGGAPAFCMFDEPNWRNKPLAQVASMAGTRAAGKALRIGLSWVVVLAGYNPTPAEEFERDASGEIVVSSRTASTQTPRNRTESQFKGPVTTNPTLDMEELLICPIHGYNPDGEIILVPDRNGVPRQVTFFKTEKMKNHSHPIPDTDPTEWCNRYDVVKLIESGKVTIPSPPGDPAPVPEPEPEPEPVPAVVEDPLTGVSRRNYNELPDEVVNSDAVHADARVLAAEYGLDWEVFVADVLSGNTWEQFVNMGGTLDIAEKRINLILDGAST